MTQTPPSGTPGSSPRRQRRDPLAGSPRRTTADGRSVSPHRVASLELQRRAAHLPVSPSGASKSVIYQALHRGDDDDDDKEASDSVGGDVLDVNRPSMRRAAREFFSHNRLRSRRSLLDFRVGQSSGEESALGPGSSKGSAEGGDEGEYDEEGSSAFLAAPGATGYGSLGAGPPNGLPTNGGSAKSEHQPLLPSPGRGKSTRTTTKASASKPPPASEILSSAIQQTTAVLLIAFLNMMISIPFGASYFPIGWQEAGDDDADAAEEEDDGVNGTFPLPGKQALGIRMFLFATFMGQFAMIWTSKFESAVALQMVENVPFLHSLCRIAISHQGYGTETLSTLFFLFGSSSILVGLAFYLLGKWKLGKVVYFFPSHVLVGCIGGIGIFIVATAIEVTTNTAFTFDADGLRSLTEHFHLLAPVVFFEGVLRILLHATQDDHGKAKYPILSPVYYCLLTPAFYLGLWILGVPVATASDLGYFFPPIADGAEASGEAAGFLGDPHLWDIFKIVDFSTVSFRAVLDSTGTMIALAAFSLIHVPINIPAFAISTDVDADMNAELIAHGYSNAFSGLFGGLQNYMTYSNSVLYARSGGKGTASSLAITLLTMVLFVIGPSIASYLPRCMAGTLLLHIGIDLTLEGIYDSIGQYDYLEYAGIWAIALVMTIWGMTAALIAGVIAALTTYAVQSINYQNPIRQILTASTLRSSAWTRCAASRAILEHDASGRSRILVFQLQGHLFFGNVAQLTDTIKEVLKAKKDEGNSPIVVIVDFTLVVGMDSSAAHAVAKLKKIIHRLFHVEVSIFVTGSDRGGFPCEFALSAALSPEEAKDVARAGHDYNDLAGDGYDPEPEASQWSGQKASQVKRGSISVSRGTTSVPAARRISTLVAGRVCESLDDALKFAEDILIARANPSLEISSECEDPWQDCATFNMTLDEEQHYAKKYLRELFPKSDNLEETIDILWSTMKREEYKAEDVIWESGAESDSMKVLVSGELLSLIEDTGASESVKKGNIIGELGLVHGTNRLTTLLCSSDTAVLYTLHISDFKELREHLPRVAEAIDHVVIRYLAHRVQHVNNRYFHTTLPV